jgi:CBS domain-containing protein
MKLVDLLAPERVVVPLVAQNLREAGQGLIEALIASGLSGEPETLRQLATQALPQDAVTLGGQAYFIHFRTDAVKRLVVALGVAPAPIARRREVQARRGARIVVLILAPQREAALYLQAASAFARTLGRREVVDALHKAQTAQEVLQAAPLGDVQLPGQLMVRDFMNPKVLSVRPEQTLEFAARLMVAHGIPSLPVVNEAGVVLGIVTHREVLQFLLPKYVKRVSTGEFLAPVRRDPADRRDPGTVPVREAMDRSVLCISEDQTLADVASLIVNKDIDRFPIVRDGVLVGSITRGDIVRRLFGP